jgi:uncharacterized membrane protein YdjX (TVP38/TMEM64 family)
MPVSSRLIKRSLILILCLMLIAVAVFMQSFSMQDLLEIGAQLATRPETIIVLIVLQALLYAFALPGTAVVWLVAPFHTILASICILLAGSVLGALAAYKISAQFSEDWRPQKAVWLLNILRHRSDVYTQCALRILPGFPHWAINYGAGALKVPLLPFLVAATVGLSVKWALYSWLIHDISNAAQAENALELSSLLPLIALAVLVLVGGGVRRSMIRKNLREKF